jgi:hypothetical protein
MPVQNNSYNTALYNLIFMSLDRKQGIDGKII